MIATFSIAGVGYDAKVAYDFNNGTKRNFLGYFIQIVKIILNSNRKIIC